MEIYKKPGTKDRLLEMMEGVNKIKLNENFEKKEDSQPFGGSKEKYQDGIGYGDEKPVNPKLRVKAPELEKFVKENEEGEDENKEEITTIDVEKEETLENDKEETPETEDNQEEVPALDVDDVDGDGDNLEGGLADNADVMEFDPQQILKGIEVEMEHTKDPRVALEIAMDHLKELPDYYTRLDAMEKQGEEDIESLDSIGMPGIDNSEKPIPSIDLPGLGGPVSPELQQHLTGIQDADKELEDTMLGFDTNTPNKAEEDEQ